MSPLNTATITVQVPESDFANPPLLSPDGLEALRDGDLVTLNNDQPSEGSAFLGQRPKTGELVEKFQRDALIARSNSTPASKALMAMATFSSAAAASVIYKGNDWSTSRGMALSFVVATAVAITGLAIAHPKTGRSFYPNRGESWGVTFGNAVFSEMGHGATWGLAAVIMNAVFHIAGGKTPFTHFYSGNSQDMVDMTSISSTPQTLVFLGFVYLIANIIQSANPFNTHALNGDKNVAFVDGRHPRRHERSKFSNPAGAPMLTREASGEKPLLSLPEAYGAGPLFSAWWKGTKVVAGVSFFQAGGGIILGVGASMLVDYLNTKTGNALEPMRLYFELSAGLILQRFVHMDQGFTPKAFFARMDEQLRAFLKDPVDYAYGHKAVQVGSDGKPVVDKEGKPVLVRDQLFPRDFSQRTMRRMRKALLNMKSKSMSDGASGNQDQSQQSQGGDGSEG